MERGKGRARDGLAFALMAACEGAVLVDMLRKGGRRGTFRSHTRFLLHWISSIALLHAGAQPRVVHF